MKEPKKKKEILAAFENVLKQWIENNCNNQQTDKTILENKTSDFCKECVRDLQQRLRPSDVADTIIEKLQNQKYIKSRMGNTITKSLSDELNPVLEDWYFTEENIEWLKANDLLNDSDYV
ncbi:MAG: hypothetical protein J6Q47_00380 [Paludibacteraceae bacterium]|nr:hypothetical protein [Paludibacteraceae bacterium]